MTTNRLPVVGLPGVATIGARMKAAREASGLGPIDAADLLGWRLDTLQNIESGLWTPRPAQVEQWEALFGKLPEGDGDEQ